MLFALLKKLQQIVKSCQYWGFTMEIIQSIQNIKNIGSKLSAFQSCQNVVLSAHVNNWWYSSHIICGYGNIFQQKERSWKRRWYKSSKNTRMKIWKLYHKVTSSSSLLLTIIVNTQSTNKASHKQLQFFKFRYSSFIILPSPRQWRFVL